MTEITFEDRIAGLRGWARGLGTHEQAAVELLIWKESWLRRADFVDACVCQYAPRRTAVIDWNLARHFLASRPAGASSELKILGLAVDLATLEYPWLTGMGSAHRQAIADAVTAALGIGEEN